jgi:hypothetical protein
MLENEKPIIVVKYIRNILFISIPIFSVVYLHCACATNIHRLTIAIFATFSVEFSLEGNPTYLFGYTQILSHCHDAVGEPFVC